MRMRCQNPNDKSYERYGGRGIKVCKEWQESFEAFYAYIGDPPSAGHTIERIDNDGHYEPGNCRWATRVEQAYNTRQARHFTMIGVTDTINGWARRLGVSSGSISYQLSRGLLFQRAVVKLLYRGKHRECGQHRDHPNAPAL